MTRHLFAAGLALSLLTLAPAHAAPPSAKIVAGHRAIFEQVWRTVRDAHYDPHMNGVNWNAVHTKYLPQALKATDERKFYAVLNAMLGELKQSHLGAIPPSALRGAKAVAGTVTAPTGEPGETGLVVEWIENAPVVVRVADKSAGMDAGVKPGMTVVAINAKPVAPLLASLGAAKPNRRPGEERVEVWALMGSLLSGTVNTPYTLLVKDASGAEQTLTVTPRKSQVPMLTVGALPPLAADIETRTLAGNIGYVRFSIFLLPLSDPVKDALRGFAAKNAPAIIIDLRGNRGGVGVMASGIAGVLTAKETNLGTMRVRSAPAPLSFTVYPQEPVYGGRVVMLVDEGSISTSEIMAAGLQEAHRATIIGRQTAGMVLPSQIITLPDGGRLQYVFADFRTPKGTVLEGRGVLPDIAVPLTRESLAASASGDAVLDAALAFINQSPADTTAAPKEPVTP